MDALQELYQSIILEHNRSPQNFGELPGADRSSRGYNASCGDDIHVHVKFQGGKIDAIRFTGVGCAIARASASLMTGAVGGLAIGEARRKAREMVDVLTGKVEGTGPEECSPLLGVRQFPMRIKCATLAWHALLDDLRLEDG
jgi:nitrogen fixation NifU-like protein